MMIRTIRHMIFAAATATIKTPRQRRNKRDKRVRNYTLVCQRVRSIKIDHGE
jgi:hypothetical protein